MNQTRPVNIGVIGFGQVGGALVRTLAVQENLPKNFPLRLVAACARQPHKYLPLEGVRFTTSYEDILADTDIDVVVELVGGASTPEKIISTALEKGRHVVTANAAVLAAHGKPLLQLAASKNIHLRFAGALMGGVSLSENLARFTALEKPETIVAGLNVASNAIFSRMEATGCSFDEALKAAVEFGYTGRNPAADVAGKDLLHKMILLRALSLGIWSDPSTVATRGIAGVSASDVALAHKLGYRFRLLGVADQDDIRIAPHLVHSESLFGALAGPASAFALKSPEAGTSYLMNQGGELAGIVQVLLGDLLAIARGTPPVKYAFTADDIRARSHDEGSYFIRLPASARARFTGSARVQVCDEAHDDATGQTGLIVQLFDTLAELEKQLGKTGMEKEDYAFYRLLEAL